MSKHEENLWQGIDRSARGSLNARDYHTASTGMEALHRMFKIVRHRPRNAFSQRAQGFRLNADDIRSNGIHEAIIPAVKLRRTLRQQSHQPGRTGFAMASSVSLSIAGNACESVKESIQAKSSLISSGLEI